METQGSPNASGSSGWLLGTERPPTLTDSFAKHGALAGSVGARRAAQASRGASFENEVRRVAHFMHGAHRKHQARRENAASRGEPTRQGGSSGPERGSQARSRDGASGAEHGDRRALRARAEAQAEARSAGADVFETGPTRTPNVAPEGLPDREPLPRLAADAAPDPTLDPAAGGAPAIPMAPGAPGAPGVSAIPGLLNGPLPAAVGAGREAASLGGPSTPGASGALGIPRLAAQRAAEARPAERGAPVPEAERAASVLQQIRLALAPGMREATVQLNPPALGRITLRVALRGGRISAVLRADSAETLSILERHAPELKAVLEQQGVAGERFELELGLQGKPWGFSPRQQDRHDRDGARAFERQRPAAPRDINGAGGAEPAGRNGELAQHRGASGQFLDTYV